MDPREQLIIAAMHVIGISSLREDWTSIVVGKNFLQGRTDIDEVWQKRIKELNEEANRHSEEERSNLALTAFIKAQSYEVLLVAFAFTSTKDLFTRELGRL